MSNNLGSTGLSAKTIDKIHSVFARYPNIEQAILYGSRAKGTFRNGSDIDLTLRGDTLTHRELSRIENELDDLLLPYKIDLSLFRQIDNPNLIEHIGRVGVVFYEGNLHLEIRNDLAFEPAVW